LLVVVFLSVGLLLLVRYARSILWVHVRAFASLMLSALVFFVFPTYRLGVIDFFNLRPSDRHCAICPPRLFRFGARDRAYARRPIGERGNDLSQRCKNLMRTQDGRNALSRT
jgi:hypothetical protein